MNDEVDKEGVRETKGPSIGPTLPPHLIASQQSKSVATIGPSLPAHLQRNEHDDLESSQPPPPKRVLGPTLPSREGTEEEPKLSSAALAFLDREKRMKEASERQAAGLAPLSEESSNIRPEWMLAPPTAKSFSETIQMDQSAALKNRGFSQAQNARVQRGKGGSGLGGIGEEDSSLWTETPQERAKRLMEEELGIRPKGDTAQPIESEEDREKRRADQKREEQLQKAIAEHSATRGPSLLEQHQAKRRTELRSKDKKRRHDSDRKKKDESESESDSDRLRRKHRRHKDSEDRHRRREREKSMSESESSSDSSRHVRKEKRKSRHHDSGRDKEEDRHRRDRHSQRTESEERDRDRRRKEKEKEREKRHKRKEREREEKGEKKGAPMMVWDRDAAMSVGGKLLDDQKRMETIRSASSLGSRFGGGSSRYL